MNYLKLAIGDPVSPMDDDVEMLSPKATGSPSDIQYQNNNAALPNQHKPTANFNFHIDEQRVDVNKALCFQSHEINNNGLTSNVLVMKKAPILMSPSNGEQAHHFVDCNNNLNPPIPAVIEPHLPPSQIYPPKHFTAHPLSPLNINTQFHPPQFINHLNWNQPQFQ